MNVIASTYELPLLPPCPPLRVDRATPTGTFVCRLVASLAATFCLDERERELTRLLFFGRSLGAIAKTLGVDTSEAQRRCRALFAATYTGGREPLFELALRLTTTRELSNFVVRRQAES